MALDKGVILYLQELVAADSPLFDETYNRLIKTPEDQAEFEAYLDSPVKLDLKDLDQMELNSFTGLTINSEREHEMKNVNSIGAPEASSDELSTIKDKIQNNLFLRANKGLLDKKYGADIVNYELKKAGLTGYNAAQTESGNVYIQSPNGAYFPVNPKSGDVIGDIAEGAGNVANFVPPALGAIGGLLSKSPVAGTAISGFTSAPLQSYKEAIESVVASPENQQNILQKAGDIGLTTAAETVPGMLIDGIGALTKKAGVGNLIDKALKGFERADVSESALKKAANAVQADTASKDFLQKYGIPGRSQEAFGQKVQARLGDTLNKANKVQQALFSFADNLGVQAAKKGTPNIPIEVANSVKLSNAVDINPIIGKYKGNQAFDEALNRALEAKERLIGSRTPIDLNKASALDIRLIQQSVRDVLNNPAAGMNIPQELGVVRSALNKSLGQLAKQGDQAAKAYIKAIDIKKGISNLFPESVQRQIFGKTSDFGGIVEGFAKDPAMVSKALVSSAAEGASDTGAINRLLKSIQLSKGLGKEGQKELVADYITGIPNLVNTTTASFKNVSPKLKDLANKVTDIPSLKAFQNEGGFVKDLAEYGDTFANDNIERGLGINAQKAVDLLDRKVLQGGVGSETLPKIFQGVIDPDVYEPFYEDLANVAFKQKGVNPLGEVYSNDVSRGLGTVAKGAIGGAVGGPTGALAATFSDVIPNEPVGKLGRMLFAPIGKAAREAAPAVGEIGKGMANSSPAVLNSITKFSQEPFDNPEDDPNFNEFLDALGKKLNLGGR